MTPDDITRLAYDIGAKGAEPTDADRASFEQWMRGHCWAIEGDWNGRTYEHASEVCFDYVHAGAMNTRRLFAAWRDRGALDSALAQQQGKAGGVLEFSAWVGDMKTSAGMDYYVCVGHGESYGEYMTPNVYKIRGRAEYDVARWNHLFGRCDKPDILAFDTDPATPPAHSPDAGVVEPEWVAALRSEVFMAPMKSNFTLSRDELKQIFAPQPKDAT